MKTKTLKLTEEQLNELDPFISSRPLSGSWIFVAQLRVEDWSKDWDETHIRIGLVTGEGADECTESINHWLKSERVKSKQLDSIPDEDEP